MAATHLFFDIQKERNLYKNYQKMLKIIKQQLSKCTLADYSKKI